VPIGPWELVIILIILVVVFGAGRLSQIGGAVGRSVREFRSAVQDQPAIEAPAAPPARPAVAEVKCAACEASNPAGQKFCSTCGAALPTPVSVSTPAAAETTCPSCNTVNPPGQAFCGQCGTRLTRAA
jgi:sec-independent protein translocase protein TatA